MIARVRGIDLYYEVRGKGKRWLVFVNGLLADTTSWSQVVHRFTQHYRVLLYDCRGQGRSQKPDGIYHLEEHEKDLVALMDFLDIDKASLVGLSSGGAVSLRVACHLPDRVEKVVAAGAYGYVDEILWFKLDAWAEAARISSSLRFKVALPLVWGRWFLKENKETLELFREKAEAFPKEAAWSLIEGAKYQSIMDELEKVQAPVLLLVGEEDILTPVRYSLDIKRGLKRARVDVIKRAGHACSIERPEEFSSKVWDFLKNG